MKKFIYVFNKDDRDKLISAGFKLVKNDTGGDVYIFINSGTNRYDLAEYSYVESDTLTF